jgi:cytochrome P450
MVRLDVATLDLTNPRLFRDGFPHEVFTALRDLGPVHRHPPVEGPRWKGEIEFWSLVGHAEIQVANRDWQTFSAIDGPSLAATQAERRGHMIVSMDPPEHSRLRRLISSGFTPRMVHELEGRIVRRTGQILDAVAARGTCEFVSEVAYQLPMHVIADIVGIPEEDRPWVFERTDTMLRSLNPEDPAMHAQRVAERDLFEYAQQLSQVKRAHPEDDIWTTLTRAQIVDDSGAETSLSELELDMFFVILTLAGSETTRNAISQGLMALLQHRDQLALLRADPSLFPGAVDEMIRWASPVLYFGRTATRDVELGGEEIKAGDRVVLWYPSGNRDERVFVDPFRFDVRRSPNPHVSFGGGGPHYCLGANLAKMETLVMIKAIVQRFRTIEAVADATWCGAGPVHNVGVSVDSLPLQLAP